jgi:chitin disaccharide deacetylase
MMVGKVKCSRCPKVTADDFGLHPEVNRGIVELAACGRLDAVSIMFHPNADLTFIDQLVATDVALGCHLVFVEERPLLSSSPSPMPKDYFRLFLATSVASRQADWLFPEAQAQLRRAGEMGINLSFINSHQHVHLMPHVWKRLYPLLNDLALPVRGGSHFRLGPFKQMLVEASSVLAVQSTPGRRFPLIHPLGIADAGHSSVHTAIEAARRAEFLPEGQRSELVIHPGRSCSDLEESYGYWRYSWEQEWNLARTGQFERALTSLHSSHL